MSVEPARPGNLPIVPTHVDNKDRVKPPDAEKRSRFKSCCSKVWEVVKKIFTLLFCCFRCCYRSKEMTEHDKARAADSKQRRANLGKEPGAPEYRKPVFTTIPMGKVATLEDYGLKRSTDKNLEKLNEVGKTVTTELLTKSKYKDEITAEVQSVGSKIEEFTTSKSLLETTATFAPAMTVLKKFFEEQLKKNDKDKTGDSPFDLTALLGGTLALKAESFPNSVVESFQVMILAIFDILKEKKEIKLNRNDVVDIQKKAEMICDLIFKRLEDPKFAERNTISQEKFDAFIRHKALIREIIVQCTQGIPMQLDRFNTKEILHTVYDMFVFVEAAVRMAADKNGQGQKIREMLQGLGQSLNADLPQIVDDLIKNNAGKVVEHLGDRMSEMFGVGKVEEGDLTYVEHRRKIDNILGHKDGLKSSIEAIVEAENQKLGFEERSKASLSPKELSETAEDTFVNVFTDQKGCHQRIKERVKASQLPPMTIVEELRQSAISSLSDMLITKIFQPIEVVDDKTKKSELVPWLRVLWNSLEKPVKLQQHLDNLEKGIDLIITEQNIQFKTDANQFKSHLKGIVQYLIVHFVNAKLEEFIKTKIMDKLFGLMADRHMLFKLIFDALYTARISEALEQLCASKKDRDNLFQNFENLHKAKDDQAKQQIRIDIANLLYPILKDTNNQLTITDMDKEGIQRYSIDASGQKIDGRFIELALPSIIELEEFIAKNSGDIKKAVKEYLNQPLTENRKKIGHLNDNLSDMVETIVFQIGKLETPFSMLGVKLFKKYIIEMLAKLIVPIRNSPYYLLKMYADSLQEKTQLKAGELHKYINENGAPVITPEREKEQYHNFAKLLYDVIHAKSSLVGVLNTKKTVTQIQSATERIFKALYDHPVVHLNSAAKGFQTYSSVNLFA